MRAKLENYILLSPLITDLQLTQPYFSVWISYHGLMDYITNVAVSTLITTSGRWFY